MRISYFILPLTLQLLCLSTFAQFTSSELNTLRKHLGISPQQEIYESYLHTKGVKPHFKVYLAAGVNIKVQDNFNRWITEWNQQRPNDQSVLVVKDLESADVILSWYMKWEDVSTEDPEVILDPRTLEPSIQSTSKKSRRVQTYAYIIRQDNKKLTVIFRDSFQSDTRLNNKTGNRLWATFKQLLLAQGKWF